MVADADATKSESPVAPGEAEDESNDIRGLRLIVGHTTDTEASVWVRGGERARLLHVTATRIPEDDDEPIVEARGGVRVYAEHDYTGVIRLQKLEPNRGYLLALHAPGMNPVNGSFQTFPTPGSPKSFEFLHGSCNLPIARLTSLGATAAGLVGGEAMFQSLKRPTSEWETRLMPRQWLWAAWPPVRPFTRWVLQKASYAPRAVMSLTQFEQPEAMLRSPFRPVLEATVFKQTNVSSSSDWKGHEEQRPKKPPSERPAFMIHCGDQIYHDLDFPAPPGHVKDYRQAYRQAWFGDPDASMLLRNLTHYMILDDHELADGFGTDPAFSNSEARLRGAALNAYDDYVSSRQPRPKGRPEAHHFDFTYGNTGFFVFDTRTERSAHAKQIVSEEQLRAFESWLAESTHDLRFVVSSVPFVAQLRPPGLDRSGARHGDGRADKWSGKDWKTQRDRVIRRLFEQGNRPLIFLVGDMHCTYHATLQIGEPRERVLIHELAGGPVNQLLFATRDRFYDRFHGSVPKEKGPGGTVEELPWVSTLQAFNGASPSILRVSVSAEKGSPLEVRWSALRTSIAPDERKDGPNRFERVDPDELRGRIRFYRPPEESS